DPAALTHDIGTFIPIPNRYGFAPAILVPTAIYLMVRGLQGGDRFALVLTPMTVLAAALVHARDAVHILIVMAGAAVALALGPAEDRARLRPLIGLLVISLALLGVYQVIQSRAVEHVSQVTSSLRVEFIAYMLSLLHDPASAIWGTVPTTIVS